MAAMVAAADGMVLFGDTAMSADPANIYLDYVSKVYGVEIDGNGFIEGLSATLQ
jgi:raffinose/stachyose/melibiose transport system substrate-binding protein